MKFGGTSVANGEKIRHVAELLKQYHEEGNELVAVTSALGGVTDGLLGVANEVSENGNVSRVKEFMEDLKQKHYDAIHVAIDSENLRSAAIEKGLIG